MNQENFAIDPKWKNGNRTTVVAVLISLVVGCVIGSLMSLPVWPAQVSETQRPEPTPSHSFTPIKTQDEIDAQLSGNELFYAMVTRALVSSTTNEQANSRTYRSLSGFEITHPVSWIMLPGIDIGKSSYFSIHNPGGFLAFAEVDHDEKNDMKVEAYISDRTKEKDIPATVDEWVGSGTKSGRIFMKNITIDGKKAILVRSKIIYDEFVSNQEVASVYFIDGNKAVNFNLFTFSKDKPDQADEQVFLNIVRSFRFTNSSN